MKYKESELGKERRAKNKENAAKNIYHHKMGPGGYKTTTPKWDIQEATMQAQGIIPETHDWPIWSRNWLLGLGVSMTRKREY
jgi:hypothetical protein